MDFNDLIEYLYVTDQLDNTFGLKEKCPECHSYLEETNDNAYPYYCPNCDMFLNIDKTQGLKKSK